MTVGQLIELFSYSWIIHALFWLAPSHFHEGNLNNHVIVLRMYLYIIWFHVFLTSSSLLYPPPPPKNYMSRAFLTGELRIINIGKNEKSATRWPTVSKRMHIFFHLYPNSVVIRAVYWILFFGCFIIHELIKKYSENKKKSCILKYENLELKFAVNKSTNCICIFFFKIDIIFLINPACRLQSVCIIIE